MRLWKLVLLSSILAVGSWLGWRFVNQSKTTLLALDTSTGKLQWIHPIKSQIYSNGTIAANGKVLLSFCQDKSAEQKNDRRQCNFYQLQAFDADSGRILWTYQPQGSDSGFETAFNPSVIFQNNQLYIQVNNELRSLDPATGQPRWAIQHTGFDVRVVGNYDPQIVTLPNQLATIDTVDKQQRILKLLDPQTGKPLQQITILRDRLTSSTNLIAANNLNIFLATSGLIQLGANEFYSNGRSTITAYNSKTGKPRFSTNIAGEIENMQVVQNTLQIKTYGTYDPLKKTLRYKSSFLAVDANTGRLLWQKPLSQIACADIGYSWRVDADSVYVNCNHYSQLPRGQDSSTIVALSAQTGQIKWQYQASPNLYSEFLPNVVSPEQFLTFRKVTSGNSRQTQAIALNRQTGKLLWSFALDDDRYVDKFRAIVASDRNRLFILDFMPRWQIWLLQLNSDWYFQQPIQP